MRVYDDEQVTAAAESECHEAFFVHDIGIFASQPEVVFQDRDRFSETHLVRTQVRCCFTWVPLEPHGDSV